MSSNKSHLEEDADFFRLSIMEIFIYHDLLGKSWFPYYKQALILASLQLFNLISSTHSYTIILILLMSLHFWIPSYGLHLFQAGVLLNSNPIRQIYGMTRKNNAIVLQSFVVCLNFISSLFCYPKDLNLSRQWTTEQFRHISKRMLLKNRRENKTLQNVTFSLIEIIWSN